MSLERFKEPFFNGRTYSSGSLSWSLTHERHSARNYVARLHNSFTVEDGESSLETLPYP